LRVALTSCLWLARHVRTSAERRIKKAVNLRDVRIILTGTLTVDALGPPIFQRLDLRRIHCPGQRWIDSFVPVGREPFELGSSKLNPCIFRLGAARLPATGKQIESFAIAK
ncbi:MAG: hypothetical protein QOF56_3932, partial [Acidobacteriaceae bacterium]|nr:hypothetical protein [Acidobacteriaceae bacterium]